MNGHATAPAIRHRGQGGFSLVEIMVAMVLGLILLAGITLLVTSASRSNRDVERAARRLENGRYAAETLADEIQHAGYYGGLYPNQAPAMPAVPAALPNACTEPATAANLTADMPLFIQGEDSPTGNPTAACLADADHVDGTDIVVVRRADTVTTTPTQANAAANTFFIQASATQFSLDSGSNSDPTNNGFGVTHKDLDADGNPDPADIRAWHVDIFYISPRTRPVNAPACDGNADTGDAVPTLMRLRLDDTAWCAEPIAAGIENLQLEYGIDTSGNGTPNAYEEHPDNPQEWANIMGVRIYLLARSAETTPGFTDTKSYTLGEGVAGPDGTDTYGPFNDGYPRHVFTTTARLVNPSGRREAP